MNNPKLNLLLKELHPATAAFLEYLEKILKEDLAIPDDIKIGHFIRQEDDSVILEFFSESRTIDEREYDSLCKIVVSSSELHIKEFNKARKK